MKPSDFESQKPGDKLQLSLSELEPCFQGVIPAMLATCSPDGAPNMTALSIVHRVDDEHVALSFQFFNKTRANILSNPQAQVLLANPKTMLQYRLTLCYERTETEGAIFERMRSHLDAIASQTGMTGTFQLRGSDIYRVLGIETLHHDLDLELGQEMPIDRLTALEQLSQHIEACDELDTLLDVTLNGLDQLLGYSSSFFMLLDGAGERLFTVKSHGFESSGAGAEVTVGEGLIGTAAAERRAIRTNHVRHSLTFARAVRASTREAGLDTSLREEIPLPGLEHLQSQLVVPILTRDRLLGVLCLQSETAGRFFAADEQIVKTLCRYVASSMALLSRGAFPDAPAVRSYGHGAPVGGRHVQVRRHRSDDSLFVDNQYLIKGLPGRILWRLLSICQRDGRVDFTNKELRVDLSLELPGFRDNLEARLILLRQRLEDRTAFVRLVKAGRGRFRIELRRGFDLLELD